MNAEQLSSVDERETIVCLLAVQKEDSNLSVNGSLYAYHRHWHYNAVSSLFRRAFTNQSLTISYYTSI